VSARVTPPIRVGEWVRVVSGGDPDASGAADFEPQVVDRADQPAPSSPLPVAAEMHQLDSARGMNDEPGALTDGELETIRRYVEHCVRGELHALVELRGKGVGYLARLLGEVDRLRERKREARG
jgi:hypothetical protein